MGLLNYNTEKPKHTLSNVVSINPNQRFIDEGKLALEEQMSASENPYARLFEKTVPTSQESLIEMGRQRIREREPGLLKGAGLAIARGVPALGQLTGHALKTLDPEGGIDVVDRFGQKIIDVSERMAETDIMRPRMPVDEGFVGRGIRGGLESAIPSFAPMVAGAGAGAAIGSVVPGVGTVIGGIIGGAAATLGIHGLGVYGQEKERYLQQGIDEKTAHKAATQQGLVEGGIETVSNIIGMLTFGWGKLASQPLKQTAKELLKTPVKTFAKNLTKNALLNEVPTEMIQGALGAKIDERIGLLPEGAWQEAAVESIIPALTMSVIFGLGAQGATSLQRNNIKKQLNSENPKERVKAAEYIAGNIDDNELRQAWIDTVTPLINEGLPININADFTQTTSNEIDQVKADIKSGLMAEGIKSGDLTSEMMAPVIEKVATQDPALADQITNMFAVKETDLTENERRFEEDPLDAENNAEYLNKYIKRAALPESVALTTEEKIEERAKILEEAPRRPAEISAEVFEKELPAKERKPEMPTPTEPTAKIAREPVGVEKKAIAGEKIEKPVKKIAAEKEEVVLFDTLPERAKGAIASDAMVKGQKAEEFIHSEWVQKIVSIESLKDKNESVWSDKFIYRKSESKDPLIVSTDGEVLDGNNRLREAIERDDKQIEILERKTPAKPLPPKPPKAKPPEAVTEEIKGEVIPEVKPKIDKGKLSGHTETLQEYLKTFKKEIGKEYFEDMKYGLIEQHYADIETHIKAGGKISQKVFGSLETDKQKHFNKHYNSRNDKIEVEKQKVEVPPEKKEPWGMTKDEYFYGEDQLSRFTPEKWKEQFGSLPYPKSKTIKIYRGAWQDERKHLDPGDWVTLDKKFAKENYASPEGIVLSKKVPLSELMLNMGTSQLGKSELIWKPEVSLEAYTKEGKYEKLADKRERQIQQAISEGKNIPPEVLKDYPDLKAGEKVEVETTPEGKEISVDLTKKEEAAVTPKQQKEYLLAEIDKAIEAELKTEGFEGGIETAKDLLKRRINPLIQSKTTYKFEVPNDGTFEIAGSVLFEFQSRVKSTFPSTITSKKFKPTIAKKSVPTAKYNKILGKAPKELKPADIDRVFEEVADTEARDITGAVLLNPFQNWLLSQDITKAVKDKIRSVAGKDYIDEARAKIETQDIEYAKSMVGYTRNEYEELQSYYSEYKAGEKTLKQIAKETGVKRSGNELAEEASEAKSAYYKAVEHLEKLEKPIGEKEPAEKPEGIEDVGEKLGGARKDLARQIKSTIPDDDVASHTLSEIWPKPKLEDMDNSFESAFVFAARAEIPSKPRVKFKLQRWADKVRLLRGLAEKILSGEMNEQSLGEAVKRHKFTARLEGFFNKIAVFQKIDKNLWDTIDKLELNPEAYLYEEDGKTLTPYLSVNRKLYRYKKSFEEIIPDVEKALKESIDKPKKAMQFEVRGNDRTGYFINKKGDAEYRPLEKFDTAKEALEYKRTHADDLVAEWEKIKAKDNVHKTDVRNKINRARTGKDHRGGKDVGAEEFREAFGFRGVEFGLWVKQGKNAKDRQGMVNAAYDALLDLSGILGIPPKAISLNGDLGLGFGSRGHGAAAAHFEPDTFVINLTKPSGAGSLAHEWFHALDNYFQRERGVGKGREGSFITYRPETIYRNKKTGRELTARPFKLIRENREDWERVEGVRPEVEKSFADLVKALNESDMYKRSLKLTKGKSDYWSRIIERAARSFESYIIGEMNAADYSNDYLANVKQIEDFEKSHERYPYLTAEELVPIKKAFDNLFSTLKTKETDKGVKLFATKAIKPQDTITRADLKSIFAKMKNISTGVDKDGNFFFRPLGKPVVTVYEVNHIEGYIDTSKGQIPVGSFLGNTIELKTGGEGHTADIGTAWHEYEHWMEANGILSNNDVKALDTALEKQGITPNTETRAEYVGNRLSEWQSQKNLRIKRVLKKIADFVNSIWEFVSRTRTARGVLADIETGAILSEKELSAVNQFAQDVSFSLKKAAKAITDNPNFVKWFGDSKVLNKDGSPMVVYHGTDKDFTVFREGTFDVGIHLGTAEQASDRLEFKAGEDITLPKQAILPLYVRMENPLALKTDPGLFDFANFPWALDELGEFTEKEINSLKNYESEDYRLEDEFPEGQDLLFARKELMDRFRQDVQSLLNKHGYDGIKYWNTGEIKGMAAIVRRLNAAESKTELSDIYEEKVQLEKTGGDWSYVAFKPTQIKSIYNTGAFGITEPDIMFATKPTKDYKAMLRRYQEAHTTPLVDELIKKTQADIDPVSATPEETKAFFKDIRLIPKRFRSEVLSIRDMKWYHKAFETPYVLAKKFVSMKAAVKTEINRHESRTKKMFGYYHGDLADLQKHMQKNPEDLKAFESLVWEWEGHRFSEKEVPTDWYSVIEDVKDDDYGGIRINPEHYTEVRKYLKKQGVKDIIADGFVAVRKILDNVLIEADATMRGNNIDQSDLKEFRSYIGKAHNYFSHIREGNSYIKITNLNTKKTVYREHFWALKERALPERKMAKTRTEKWLNDQLTSGKLSGKRSDYLVSPAQKVTKLPDEIFFQIPVEALSQISIEAGKGLSASRVHYEALRLMKKEGLSEKEAHEKAGNILTADMGRILAKAMSDVLKTRGWGKHAIQRQNIPGFKKTDVFETLSSYLTGYAGFATKIQAAKEHSKTLRDIDARKTPVAYKYTSEYVRDMLANADKTDQMVDRLRGLFFVKYLGGVVKSGIVNLTQNAVMAGPVLSQYTKFSHTKLAKAMKDVRKAIIGKNAWIGKETDYKNLSKNEQKALTEMVETGAAQDLYLRELKGDIPGKGWGKYVRKVIDKSGIFMMIAEKFNRASTGLAAYRIAMNEGTTFEGESTKDNHDLSVQFAKGVIYDSHFLYGKPNLPAGFRGGDFRKIARAAYTFRSFTHNYLDIMVDLMANQGTQGFKVAGRSLMNLMVVGGLTSIPFFKALSEVIKWASDDEDEDLLTEIRGTMSNKFMQDVLVYGLVGASGGFDLSGSLSIEVPQSFKDLIGVPYAVKEDYMNMVKSVKAGNLYRAVSETPFTPIVMRNAMRGIELYTKGQRTRGGKAINVPGKKEPRKITGAEAIKKGILGLQPTEVSSGYKAYRAATKMKRAIADRKRDWADRIANATIARDFKKVREIKAEIREWNTLAKREGKRWRIVDITEMVKGRLTGKGLRGFPVKMRKEAQKRYSVWQ